MEVVIRILDASWLMLGEMAPYLLLGFFVAGVLSVLVSAEWVERHLGRGGVSQVVKASVFGVPLPLCSCGVLPVAASLRRHGASRGATTSFLLSTPQTGVDSIAVTVALLGPVVAVIRPLAAFVTGVLGGILVQVADSDSPSGAAEEGALAQSHESSCCAEEGEHRNPVLRALRYGFVVLPRDIARALVVGILLSGVIAAFLGPDALQGVLGRGPLPYLVAMLVGVPLYVCATASTPIAASLIGAGLSPGAALVFLISGPATNGAALATLLSVLGRKTVAIYLATVVVGSLATGILVDTALDSRAIAIPEVVAGSAVSGHEHHGAAEDGFGFKAITSVLFLAVLAAALWPRRRSSSDNGDDSRCEVGDRLTLEIKGMRCHGCVDSVTRALQEASGVREAVVDLEAARAVVTGRGLEPSHVCDQVRSLGFECEVVG